VQERSTGRTGRVIAVYDKNMVLVYFPCTGEELIENAQKRLMRKAEETMKQTIRRALRGRLHSRDLSENLDFLEIQNFRYVDRLLLKARILSSIPPQYLHPSDSDEE